MTADQTTRAVSDAAHILFVGLRPTAAQLMQLAASPPLTEAVNGTVRICTQLGLRRACLEAAREITEDEITAFCTPDAL